MNITYDKRGADIMRNRAIASRSAMLRRKLSPRTTESQSLRPVALAALFVFVFVLIAL